MARQPTDSHKVRIARDEHWPAALKGKYQKNIRYVKGEILGSSEGTLLHEICLERQKKSSVQ